MKKTRIQTGKQNAPPPAKVATAPPLSESEWNFDSVESEELEVCCYWEYARESKFIRSVRERFRGIAGSALDFKNHQEIVGSDFMKIVASIGRPAYLFQGDVCDFDSNAWLKMGALSPASPSPAPPEAPPESKLSFKRVASPFPEPWQSIPRDVRLILVKTAARPSALFPAFRWASRFYARQMADLCEAQNPPPKVSPEKRTPCWRKSPISGGIQEEFWGDMPREERPSRLFANGVERLIVEIEWGRFNNEEIIACFHDWVKVHRPKSVKAPSGKGHKKQDWRVALNRLGVMRALNAASFAHPRFPQPFKDRGEKFCYEARQRALEKFRELLAFLPEEEVPIHSRTKGRNKGP
jgi:hypothetical protein